MKDNQLKSNIRAESGKKTGHKIRKEGKIPGILYGHGEEPLALEMDKHDVWEVLHKAKSRHLVVGLEVEGVDLGNVVTLVKDVQQHPVTGEVLHIDFLRVYKDEMINVDVPVKIIGTAKGVKESGGILYHSIRNVTVNSKPTEIPEAIEVDVTELEIGQSIHITDIIGNYSDIEFVYDADITLAHVAAPKELELPEEEGEEVLEGEEAEGEEGEGGEEEAEEDKEKGDQEEGS